MFSNKLLILKKNSKIKADKKKLYKLTKLKNLDNNITILENSIPFLYKKSYASDRGRFLKKIDLLLKPSELKSPFKYLFDKKTNNLILFKLFYKKISFNRTSLVTSSIQLWGILSIFSRLDPDELSESFSLKLQLKYTNALQHLLNLNRVSVKELLNEPLPCFKKNPVTTIFKSESLQPNEQSRLNTPNQYSVNTYLESILESVFFDNKKTALTSLSWGVCVGNVLNKIAIKGEKILSRRKSFKDYLNLYWLIGNHILNGLYINYSSLRYSTISFIPTYRMS